MVTACPLKRPPGLFRRQRWGNCGFSLEDHTKGLLGHGMGMLSAGSVVEPKKPKHQSCFSPLFHHKHLDSRMLVTMVLVEIQWSFWDLVPSFDRVRSYGCDSCGSWKELEVPRY